MQHPVRIFVFLQLGLGRRQVSVEHGDLDAALVGLDELAGGLLLGFVERNLDLAQLNGELGAELVLSAWMLLSDMGMVASSLRVVSLTARFHSGGASMSASRHPSRKPSAPNISHSIIEISAPRFGATCASPNPTLLEQI